MNSKQKGKRGELELANKLKEYGYNCRRTAQYNGKELGSKADVIGLAGIHIECKWVEKLNVREAMEQAVRDCKGEVPAVFHKKNGKPWLVTNLFSDWIELYKYKEAFERLSDELSDYMDYVCDFMYEEDSDYCNTNCHATREAKDCYFEYLRRTRDESI